MPYDIYYMSKNLTSVKLNYIVTKKEFLAMVHAIRKIGIILLDTVFFTH